MGWRAQHCKSPSASRCCASCVLISLSKYPGMNVECKANHFCQHTQGVGWGCPRVGGWVIGGRGEEIKTA